MSQDSVPHDSRDSSQVPRAPCSRCGRLNPVRLDGNIKKHGAVMDRCAGCGIPPAPCQVSIATSDDSTRDLLPSIVATPLAILSSSLPSVINPGRLSARILKRIPRASRDSVAKKFSSILNDVVGVNSPPSWERLFTFPSRCLCVP